MCPTELMDNACSDTEHISYWVLIEIDAQYEIDFTEIEHYFFLSRTSRDIFVLLLFYHYEECLGTIEP